MNNYELCNRFLIRALEIIQSGMLTNNRFRSTALEQLKIALDWFWESCPQPDGLINNIITSRTGFHQTLLKAAIIGNDPDAVKIVLEAGGDPNASPQPYSLTPLDVAIHIDNPEVIDILLDYRARKLNKPYNNSPQEVQRWQRFRQVITNMSQFAPGGAGYQEAGEHFEKSMSKLSIN